jgi:antitoxin HigA-1
LSDNEWVAKAFRAGPIHPGELLSDELDERSVSLNEFARSLQVPMRRVSAIVTGQQSITADIALQLARYFGTSAQKWTNSQTAYDREIAEREVLAD